MKKILYFFPLLLVCLLSGCKDNDKEALYGTRYTMSSHYVSDYLTPTKIKVVPDTGTIYVEIGGEIYATFKGNQYKHYNLVESWSELYGDTQYEGAVNAGMHPALAYPIEKITIYCNKDFNAKHLAGEPLDDIVKLNYYSYYSFIQNGYRPHPQNEQHLQDVEGYSLPLDCVTKDLTKLISLKRGLTTMEFSSAPAVPGEYNFVLEMTTNGETIKTEFSHTFE